MATNHKIPLHVTYTGNTPTGISEYQSGLNECIPVDYGGTGQNDINRGEIIVGDITDNDFKSKKLTDTEGLVSCIYDETWLIGTDRPTNQSSGNATQFYAGETIYQGESGSTTASGRIIENTGTSNTFKIHAITGTFTAGVAVWANTTVHESGAIRSVTLNSASTAITEQPTIKFKLGTLNTTTGLYTIDCGTL